MKFRPLQDRVLIQRLDEETVTPGGILIPDAAQEKQQRGTVLAVGPGIVVEGKLRAPGVSEGDTVIFGKYAGTDLKIDGVEVVVLREDDIMGVVAE